jgi:streptogramin lyase
VVVKTDTKSGESIEIPLPGFTRAVALSADAAWVTTDDSLVKIARPTASVCWVSPLEPGLAGVAVGAGAVWVASAGSVSLLRVSPQDGHLAAVVGVPDEPSGVAVAGRSVWVTGPRLGLLVEVDSLTNSIVREIDLKGVPLGTPVLSQGCWWVYDMSGGLISVDPSDGSVRRFSHSDPCIGGLTAIDGRIWQANSWKGTLREYVDGERSREIQVPGRPQEVGVVDGWLCVVTQGVTP